MNVSLTLIFISFASHLQDKNLFKKDNLKKRTGPAQARTEDLRVISTALYRLSYETLRQKSHLGDLLAFSFS